MALFAGLFTACGGAQLNTPEATFTLAPTKTASLAPTATLAPTETTIPVSRICSPLEGSDLSILNQIIGGEPFVPPPSPSQWDKGHHGVDFAYYHGGSTGGNIEGTPIQSVLDGYVAGLGYAAIYGNYLIIETPMDHLSPDLAGLYSLQKGRSLYLLYAHLRDPAAFVISEPIDCGQVIGIVGKTGDPFYVVQAHLHFETRAGPSGFRFDPMNYYDTQASEEERAQYELWRKNGTFQLYDPMILFDYAVQNQ